MRNTFPLPSSIEATEEFIRSEIAHSLVGTDVVVGVLPGAQEPPMYGDDLGDLCDVIELFPVRAMGAFDVAIELGTARWQDEEVDALGSAGLFEGGLELAAAVDLDGPHGEAETGKSSARTRSAIVLFWRSWTARMSFRLMTSRAVKWMRRRPGSTSIGVASSSTRSPG